MKACRNEFRVVRDTVTVNTGMTIFGPTRAAETHSVYAETGSKFLVAKLLRLFGYK